MEAWANELPNQIATGLCPKRYGDLPEWLSCLNQLPLVTADSVELDTEVSLTKDNLSQAEQKQIKSALKGLIPWRKGPYQIFDTYIETEWRSDWKWDRLAPHIQPLDNQIILDVGCGNGYHMWRMLGAGAARVIGVDPSPRFSVQFEMIKKLAGNFPIHLVPCALEDLPRPLERFDSVFSMGVLYHRKSPIDHLYELRDVLKPGGQLVLETLVIKGDEKACLVPSGRYAKMRNVWFIPSSKMLGLWLERLGFDEIQIVDESYTSIKEQRVTDWMQFQSLADFLDPKDRTKTVEGYPAPLRSILLATKAK